MKKGGNYMKKKLFFGLILSLLVFSFLVCTNTKSYATMDEENESYDDYYIYIDMETGETSKIYKETVEAEVELLKKEDKDILADSYTTKGKEFESIPSISPNTIIGSDDRTIVSADPRIVQMFMTYEGHVGRVGGTGFVIWKDMILTAGHNVLLHEGTEHRQMAKQIDFYLGAEEVNGDYNYNRYRSILS